MRFPNRVSRKLMRTSEQLQIWKLGSPHEVLVHSVRRTATLTDGPDDEGLAAAHIAGGEDAGDAGHVVVVHHDVAAGVELEAKLLDGAWVLGADEAHGQQAQVTVDGVLGAGDFLHRILAAL